MVLGIKKCRDLRGRDPWGTLSVQHGKDGGGRETANRVKETLKGEEGYCEKGERGGLAYFRACQYVV
jgi:hypothetical protein